jgi:hypothetical protein
MVIWARVPGTRRVPNPTEPDAGIIFYPWWHSYPTRIETGMGQIFFPPAGDSTSTRCFSTTMILYCEQVKICSFCYIDYDFC